jgi:hypothetical protein
METTPLADWLLESKIPTIRYLTLRDLLGRADDDPALMAERAAIMTNGPVPAILGKQTGSGEWAGQNNFYVPKYRSSHWSMVLLDELQADVQDPRFRQGADYMLDATAAELAENVETGRKDWECLWGNIARYAIHAGYMDDPRLKQLLDYILMTIADEVSPCPVNGDLPCGWGGGRMLWGLAAIPPEARSPEVAAAIERTVAFLLDEYQLLTANYPAKNRPSPLWLKLSFPVFYHADILFILRLLRELRLLHHPGAAAALAWLADQRGADGRWVGESPFRKQTWGGIGNPEDTNRWVSLYAAAILQDAAEAKIHH